MIINISKSRLCRTWVTWSNCHSRQSPPPSGFLDNYIICVSLNHQYCFLLHHHHRHHNRRHAFLARGSPLVYMGGGTDLAKTGNLLSTSTSPSILARIWPNFFCHFLAIEIGLWRINIEMIIIISFHHHVMPSYLSSSFRKGPSKSDTNLHYFSERKAQAVIFFWKLHQLSIFFQ